MYKVFETGTWTKREAERQMDKTIVLDERETQRTYTAQGLYQALCRAKETNDPDNNHLMVINS